MAVTSETTTTIKYRAAMGYVTFYQEGRNANVEVNCRTCKPEQLEEFASLLNSVAAKMKEENSEDA